MLTIEKSQVVYSVISMLTLPRWIVIFGLIFVLLEIAPKPGWVL